MSKVTKKKAPTKRKAAAKSTSTEMEAYLAQGRPIVTGSVVYMLRACAADMTSRGSFRWPSAGAIHCDDWSPEASCGRGLHGWLWGEGDIEALDSSMLADVKSRWLVVAVWSDDVVQIERKIKVPRGWVVFCGDRGDAANEIVRLGATGPVIFGTATAGARGTATAGDGGTATAGYGGTAAAGYGGVIVIERWDRTRYRLQIAYVGENGIEPNRPYRLQDDGTFVRADGVK